MNEPISTLYRRYRTAGLLLVGGLVMLLSFFWYLPGAYNAPNMGDYHVYAFREFRFNNVVAMYVNHNLDRYDGPSFILRGTGIEYPPLLSALIRGTAGLGHAQDVPFESYRRGTPSRSTAPSPENAGNPVAYTMLNYAVVFFFGLLTIFLIALWPGSRPWMFAAAPLLFLYAGYNWDLIPIAFTLVGLLLLKRSVERPSPGRDYNVWLEVAGFAMLAVGTWVKLFPILFLFAALVQRARTRRWRAAATGIAVFAALTLVINVPFALANFESWYFFLWIHQNRASELSIWYWLLGGMNPALMGRTDITATVNALSVVVVGSGGLFATWLAWRSPRRDITMPLASVLLVWWFTFNKVYDPNFDLWLLLLLAVLAAPAWLYVGFTLMSLTWYIITFIGLYLSVQPNNGELNTWFLGHASLGSLIIRLSLLACMVFWLGRELLTLEEAAELERVVVDAAPDAAARPALPQLAPEHIPH
jgi:hypothetical protein